MDPRVRQELIKKYYPEYAKFTPELEEEKRSELGKTRMAAGLAQGGAELLGAFQGGPTGVSYVAGLNESRGGRREIERPRVDHSALGKAGERAYEEGMNRFEKDRERAFKADEMGQKTFQMDEQVNPEAPRARKLRDAIKEAMPEVVGQVKGWDQMSLQDLEAAFPLIYKKYADELAVEAEKYRAQQKYFEAQEKAQTKAEERIDKATERLSKDVAGVQGTFNSLARVENELGGPLEDLEIDIKKGTVKRDGKEIDLPGASIPVLGRTTFYSGEARTLAGNIEAVFNTELKDRSGAAVTNPEMERLRREFNQGRFNTEAEMLYALQQYKRAAYEELKNREAGYDTDVLDTYRSRGGFTSSSIKPQVRSLDNFNKGPSLIDKNGNINLDMIEEEEARRKREGR